MSSLVLVLSDSRLSAYQQKWHCDVRFIGDIAIDGDQVSFLGKLIQRYRSFSCKLIVDLSDEEFVLNTLPATQKTISRKTMAVKCARYFGQNAFTVGMVVKGVGRGGKARVICAGIENRNSLHTLMQSAQQVGMVFKAVHSLAILLAYQCRQTRFRSGTLLVISSQDGRIWRYSLIQSGQLMMSRCVFIGETDDTMAEVIEELASTKTYVEKLISDSESLICLYAGPAAVEHRTLAEKLIASMSHRFRLFESDELYKALVSTSRFRLWQPGAYISPRQRKSDYRRYFWANASIVGLMILIFASSVNIYAANQHKVEHQHKISQLQNNGVELTLAPSITMTSEKLSDLALVDLHWLVQEFWNNDFMSQPQTLEYRLGGVLSKFPSVVLQSIKFENEERSEDRNVTSTRNTVLTANFELNVGEAQFDDVRGFYLAIKKANLQIVSQSHANSEFDKKGRLGGVAAKDHELRFSVSIQLGGDS